MAEDWRLGVKPLRESLGMGLSATAKLAGITKAYLWNIESCQKQPSVAVMLRLATALRVPVTQLLGLSGSSDPASFDAIADAVFIEEAARRGLRVYRLMAGSSDPEAVGLDALRQEVVDALLELDNFATWSALNRPEYPRLRAAIDAYRAALSEAKPETPTPE